MVFHTKSGSIYEVDETNMRARKIAGKDEIDKDWKQYIEMLPSVPTVGKSLYIFWEPEGSPCTITSRIVSIVGEGKSS